MDECCVDSALEGSKIDAWKAAEIQRQAMEQQSLAKMEVKKIMDKRKALRGQLAGSQIMIERVIISYYLRVLWFGCLREFI